MNYQLKGAVEAAPENKTKLIIKETAAFVGEAVDMVPSGKINWMWIVANWSTVVALIKLIIELIKRIKTITNEQ